MHQKIKCYLLPLEKFFSYWSKLPINDLTITAAILLETAGFIGNKYTHFYGFSYIFIVIFFIIFIVSLDAVKNKKIVDARIPKNNFRPVESEIKITKNISSRQCFWKGA